jgi:hypothetical protein
MVRLHIETPLRHGFLFDKIKEDSFTYQAANWFEYRRKIIGDFNPLFAKQRGGEKRSFWG